MTRRNLPTVARVMSECASASDIPSLFHVSSGKGLAKRAWWVGGSSKAVERGDVGTSSDGQVGNSSALYVEVGPGDNGTSSEGSIELGIASGCSD